jgi:hypothetical protein
MESFSDNYVHELAEQDLLHTDQTVDDMFYSILRPPDSLRGCIH